MRILAHALSIFAFLSITLSPYSQAAERGTADEAIAMVKRAVALIKTKGREDAFSAFDNPKGAFVDRDLYIAVLDEKGVVLAHGANPKLINKALIDLKDANGKLFVKELVDTTQKKGGGWVDYKWINPTNKAIESKSTYVEKVGDFVVICGIYK